MGFGSGFKPGKGEIGENLKITDGTIKVKEQANAEGNTTAYGQIWVKSNNPCDLYFTDDTGQDVRITNDGNIAAASSAGAVAADDINAGDSDVTLTAGSGDAVTINATAAQLQLKTTTSGEVDITSAGTLDINGVAIDIDGSGAVTIDTSDTTNGVKIGAGVSGMPITLGHATSVTTVAGKLTASNGLNVPTGELTLNDGIRLFAGTDQDIAIMRDATNFSIIGDTDGGHMLFTNQDADKAILFKLGSTDTNTRWAVRDSADSEKIIVRGDGSITLGSNASEVTTVTGELTCSAGANIPDDKKLYFGTQFDASVEYDEDGTNELRFAGAAVTFEQAVSMDGDVDLGLDANDVVTVKGEFTASLGALIPDDKKLYFGTDKDVSIEYDEDGDNQLLITAPSMKLVGDITASHGARFYERVSISGSGLYFNFNPGTHEGISLAKGPGAAATDRINYVLSHRSNNKDLFLYSYDGSAYRYWLKILHDNRYTALGLDGNVGVGTDAPAHQLHVDGAMSGNIIYSKHITASNGIEVRNGGTNALVVTGSTFLYGTATLAGDVTASQGLTIPDDTLLRFGSAAGGDVTMEYDEDGTNELRFAGTSQVVCGNNWRWLNNTTLAQNPGAVVTISNNLTCSHGALFADDFPVYFGTDADSHIKYDEAGTNQLIVTPPNAGMSVGSGFHRISQDVTVTKRDSTDETSCLIVPGVKIPNDSIITKVVVVVKELSSTATSLHALMLNQSDSIAADAAVGVNTHFELIGAGNSDCFTSDAGAGTYEINLGSGATAKLVHMNTTGYKTTADMYPYIINSGTGNGTSDSDGVLTVIIEYYGID